MSAFISVRLQWCCYDALTSWLHSKPSTGNNVTLTTIKADMINVLNNERRQGLKLQVFMFVIICLCDCTRHFFQTSHQWLWNKRINNHFMVEERGAYMFSHRLTRTTPIHPHTHTDHFNTIERCMAANMNAQCIPLDSNYLENRTYGVELRCGRLFTVP